MGGVEQKLKVLRTYLCNINQDNLVVVKWAPNSMKYVRKKRKLKSFETSFDRCQSIIMRMEANILVYNCV